MEVTADEVRESYDEKIIIETKNEKIEDMENNISCIIKALSLLNN